MDEGDFERIVEAKDLIESDRLGSKTWSASDSDRMLVMLGCRACSANMDGGDITLGKPKSTEADASDCVTEGLWACEADEDLETGFASNVELRFGLLAKAGVCGVGGLEDAGVEEGEFLNVEVGDIPVGDLTLEDMAVEFRLVITGRFSLEWK